MIGINKDVTQLIRQVALVGEGRRVVVGEWRVCVCEKVGVEVKGEGWAKGGGGVGGE